MLVVSLASILLALGGSGLSAAGKRLQARSRAETVAAFLENTRRRAYAEGRCYRVSVNATSGSLQAQRRSGGDCVNLAKDAWDAVTAEGMLTRETGEVFTISALTNGPATSSSASIPNNLIFRPSSRLWGDGDLVVTDDEARVGLTRGGTASWVTVTAIGRICIGGPSPTLPTFSAVGGCP